MPEAEPPLTNRVQPILDHTLTIRQWGAASGDNAVEAATEAGVTVRARRPTGARRRRPGYCPVTGAELREHSTSRDTVSPGGEAMLSTERNVFMTRVGRGQPMGELFRHFWLPLTLSEQLNQPDGDPVRVRLLGEDLVAFRDTNGRVGLVKELCAHRGASLFLGRNEEGGIRCLY